LLASGPKPGASTNFATRASLKNNNGRFEKPNHPFETGGGILTGTRWGQSGHGD
jgi:hypothetical protein